MSGRTLRLIAALSAAVFISSCSLHSKPETEEAEQTRAETANVTVPATDASQKERTMLVSKLKTLRDPFVLYDNGLYYMYGTGWTVYRSRSLEGKWMGGLSAVKDPPDCAGDRWAPEVYRFGNRYIMVTTYKSRATGHRGCSVFESSSPEGPFKEISDGHVTPRDWDSIDGTLFTETDGTVWMVFVHEWTSTDDGVGRMACAQMSEDLTHFVSEPVELFRADDPEWAMGKVTDGCFLHRSSDGTLVMIWSNWDSGGYCVGQAKSQTGKVTGPWIQLDERLYSSTLPCSGGFDGGHGMIFSDGNGKLWMSVHSPNSEKSGRNATPVFIPLKEENGILIRDIPQ